MPGVIDVVQIPDGVAVVADSYWHAQQGARGAGRAWDEGAGASAQRRQRCSTASRAASGTGKPLPLKPVGDADAAISARPRRSMRAEYVCRCCRTRRWSR